MLFTKDAANSVNKCLNDANKKALVLTIVHAGPTGRELHFGTTNELEGLKFVDNVYLNISDEDLNTLYELGVMFELDEFGKLIVTKKGKTCQSNGCCSCDGTKKACKCVEETM